MAGADSVLPDHLVFLVGLQPGFDPCAGRTFGGTFLGASDWLMGSERWCGRRDDHRRP